MTRRGGSDHVGSARGQGPATVTQVAARAGVSVATVSRTLAGNYPVATETRARVMKAVEQLGYIPNAHARALKSQARLVGIVITDVADPFFGYIARAVEREAAAQGRICLITASHGDRSGREIELVDLLREQRAEVIVLVGGAPDEPEYRRRMAKRAKAMDEVGARLVLCGRPSLGPGVPTRNVTYDNEGGAYAVTDHLITQGHRRILYVGGPTGLSTTTLRLDGFHRALAGRDIDPDPRLERIGNFGYPFGYRTMHQVLQEKLDFTAVFAANDLVASGVYDALEEAGIAVPDDVSVVGYDDLPIAQVLRPRLTTVNVPLEELGREAVRAGLSAEDPFRPLAPEIVVGTHVVIRDSVARR